jgi:hypothetical protein
MSREIAILLFAAEALEQNLADAPCMVEGSAHIIVIDDAVMLAVHPSPRALAELLLAASEYDRCQGGGVTAFLSELCASRAALDGDGAVEWRSEESDDSLTLTDYLDEQRQIVSLCNGTYTL